jgi:hypothetical protein
MAKKDEYTVELIDVGGFKVLHILSKPQRLEAKVIFDRDHISQKLIFTLMEISHAHGFGCSPPHFRGPEDSSMTFLIGSILPSKRSLKKYVGRIQDCLSEIQVFASDFSQQLDFSTLDISMFGEMELEGFYPEHLAALRDQHYDGSWEEFYRAMVSEEREDEAEIVRRCKEFEETNAKDIGLVGHKLGYMLHMLDQVSHTQNESN